MLRFQNLHIGFNLKKGKIKSLFQIEDVSFVKGEFVAIIGPNGSGKTTLFDTLLGDKNPVSGTVFLQNKDFKTLKREEKVKWMSYVPSKFWGVNNLLVSELVAMGRAPHTNLLNQLTKEDKEIVDSVLKQLRIEQLADKNTFLLSDGERQIAVIGKALAQQSEIMILDEPTAFLDYNHRRRIMQLLKEIALQKQQLIFISSHDLSLCFEFCNRIIGIDTKNQQLVDFQPPFDQENIIKNIFYENETQQSG